MNSKIEDINGCIILPTYNNEKTLVRVLNGILEHASSSSVIIVNDGSTDSTINLLKPYQDSVVLISYEYNKGKGYALRQGFKKAIELGFAVALTIDSDGQHFPEDIPNFIETSLKNPNTLIMGSRDMTQDEVPGKSSFGNKFSNFWFKLETGIELPDTQTGFRLYPLEPLKKIKLFTTKFELEIEVIVKMAWKNVPFMAMPVKVIYDYDERVSHFRPFNDFTRISVLNTYFVILTFAYYLPKRLFKSALKKKFWIDLKNNIIQPEESNLNKAVSISFGFFMGIIPLWGFQLLIGIPLSIVFKLNKALFITAANISIPPMIPIILWLSYYTGGLYYGESKATFNLSELSLESIHVNFIQYCIGAIILAIAAGIASFLVSFGLLSIFRKKGNRVK